MLQQVTPDPAALDDKPFVTQWGSDPVWDGALVAMRRVTPMQLQTFAQVVDPTRPPEPGRPVRVENSIPVRPAADEPGGVTPPPSVVGVVGYEPHFSADRQLWYVDIAFEAGATHWPFVRLALARYQPSSIEGCHLSTPVRADFVQLPPERTLTVGRPDALRVSVSLRGEYGHRDLDSRNNPLPENQQLAARDADVVRSNRVAASLQQRNPHIGGDLGWTTVASVDLTIGGHGARDTEVLWLGTLDLPEPLDLRRPLARDLASSRNGVTETEKVDPSNDLPFADPGLDFDPPSEWRVRVEEWQLVPSDPPAGTPTPLARARTSGSGDSSTPTTSTSDLRVGRGRRRLVGEAVSSSGVRRTPTHCVATTASRRRSAGALRCRSKCLASSKCRGRSR